MPRAGGASSTPGPIGPAVTPLEYWITAFAGDDERASQRHGTFGEHAQRVPFCDNARANTRVVLRAKFHKFALPYKGLRLIRI
jgi:hypothetical protein